MGRDEASNGGTRVSSPDRLPSPRLALALAAAPARAEPLASSPSATAWRPATASARATPSPCSSRRRSSPRPRCRHRQCRRLRRHGERRPRPGRLVGRRGRRCRHRRARRQRRASRRRPGDQPATPRRLLARLRERELPVLLAGMLAPPNLGRRLRRRLRPDLSPTWPRSTACCSTRSSSTASPPTPSLNQPDGIHPNAARASPSSSSGSCRR